MEVPLFIGDNGRAKAMLKMQKRELSNLPFLTNHIIKAGVAGEEIEPDELMDGIGAVVDESRQNVAEPSLPSSQSSRTLKPRRYWTKCK